MVRRAGLFASCAALAACAASQQPREFMDEASANTVLTVNAPLVFARDRADVAAHAHDFASLVAVEIDASGKYSTYLLLYRWSTVDPRMAPTPRPNGERLRIIADDRIIDLKPVESMPSSLNHRRELHVPSYGDVIAHAYPVDVPTLRFIAASRDLRLRVPEEPLDTPLTLWQDGRQGLAEFVKRAEVP